MASVAGTLASMRPALGPASRAFTQGYMNALANIRSWSDNVAVTHEVLDNTDFWLTRLDVLNGAPIHLPESFDAVIHVDASDEAWGAWCATLGGTHTSAALAFPPGMAEESSTLREMRGVLWAVEHFQPTIQSKSLLVRCDNQGVFYIIRKGGSPKSAISLVCQKILTTCMESGISLYIDWVPRGQNEYADYLSHAVEHDDWSLSKQCFQGIQDTWGPFDVDWFATPSNAQLPRYATRYYYVEAPLVNAFTLHWAREKGFACPPPSLIVAALRHGRKCCATFPLVVPWWPSASWWPLLRAKSGTTWADFVVAQLPLGLGTTCLRSGSLPSSYNGLGHPNSLMWALLCDFR